MYDDIPMPPSRHSPPSRVGTVPPDRCPAGHRGDDPAVCWYSAVDNHKQAWRCYACDPQRGVEFRARVDLYDDLSWWHDDYQVQRRAESVRMWRRVNAHRASIGWPPVGITR